YLTPLKTRVENKLGKPLANVYIDVGAAEVRNVSIISLVLKSGEQWIPLEKLTYGTSALEQLQIQATVQATGMAVDGKLKLNTDGVEDVKSFKLAAGPGETKTAVVKFPAFKRSARAYQGQVSLV